MARRFECSGVLPPANVRAARTSTHKWFHARDVSDSDRRRGSPIRPAPATVTRRRRSPSFREAGRTSNGTLSESEARRRTVATRLCGLRVAVPDARCTSESTEVAMRQVTRLGLVVTTVLTIVFVADDQPAFPLKAAPL